MTLAGCSVDDDAIRSQQSLRAAGPEVSAAAAFGLSEAVRDMPVTRGEGPRREHPLLPLPPPPPSVAGDPVVQTSAGPNVAATAGIGFAGVGAGDYGFQPNAAPPDTNGAVGATQYVQWVNESFAVFDKSSGARIAGPTAGNQLFQGLGSAHPCAVNDDGDPIAQYDKSAGRWVLTQPSFTDGASVGYFQCVAVSTTSDATGSYFLYAFQQPAFPDYPKLGVWTDAYYATFNMFVQFGGTFFFQGARACAFDRAKMLAGDPAATQVCFQGSTSVASLLPSDLDGAIAPPIGAPEYLVNFGSSSLNVYKLHVDFITPSNSTATGPSTVAVAPFTPACNSGGACIAQPSTSQRLDSLGDRLMYRLAYRNFADGHQSMVVNHSVLVSGSKKNSVTGVRWYELRISSAGAVSVYQQGTFSPDSTSRWMGSIAMDKVGDIAVGYSASSGSVEPSIRYTGRVPGETLGILEAENAAWNGAGSQLQSLSRWGDYSAMSIDPIDDCTFWYTSEYLKTSGTFNWSTRVFNFKFPGCL